MNPRGTKICVAGHHVRLRDRGADARSFERGPLLKKKGGKPYWVTQSWNGRHCYISWSGTDQIAKISYRTGRIVDRARVGDHPQRIRNGFVDRDLWPGCRGRPTCRRTSRCRRSSGPDPAV